jgi:putative transposase
VRFEGWYPLLKEAIFRGIVMDSMHFMIDESRIKLHGYAVMPNHLHMIFTVIQSYRLFEIFHNFHKYTSQQIHKITRNDRKKYQIWQTTNALKDIVSYKFYRQKLDFIHLNPYTERWNLCERPEKYPFSSAPDYILGIDRSLPIDKVYL